MSRIIAIDFETYYDNECSVKTLGNWAYARHPDWEAYMISVCDGSETWVGHPKEFNWSALEGATKVSHNAFFDRSVYHRLVEQGIAAPGLDTDWHCSSNLGAYLCGSARSLKDVSKKLLGADLSKDVRDQAKGKRWSEMQAEGWADKMVEYARRDAHLCHRIWAEHSGRMPDWEHRLSDMTIRNSMHGIRINAPLLDEYIAALHQAIFATEKQIPWIAEDYKPTSTKAFAEWCRRDNIPVPPTKEEDEEGVDKWTELYSPNRPWVQAVGAWRSLNKTLKRFLLIRSRLRPDGTMDFGLKYFGAHCVDGDHEVLTPTGWVQIDQWGGGPIAQWEPNLGSLQFLPADANQFEVEEPTVELVLNNVSARYTMGHTIPTFGSVSGGSFKTIKAGDLPSSGARFVPVSGKYLGYGLLTADQIRVLVAIQADGHFTKDGILQFCLRKARKIARLQMLLRVCGIPYRIQEFPSSPGQKRVAVSRQDLPCWVSPARKRFGCWLLDSTPEARDAFCEEVLLWDGHQPTRTYYSSIRENAEWVATIAHLSAKAGNVRERLNRGGRKPTYSVSLRETDKARLPARTAKLLPPSKRCVYCPTTKTGFWLVRHNGVIHVTGNTGRYSGDAGFNIQNQRKQPILLRDDWTMVTDKFEVDSRLRENRLDDIRVQIDERALIVPREGSKFIIADLSQIEPRVLNTLVGNHELLNQIRSGMAIYEAFARQSLGYSDPAPLKKKDARLYALAKAEVLGLGYQCGVKRFPEVAWIMAGLRIDEAEAEKAVKGFRENNPLIVGLWNQLDSAFKQSCGSDFEMELPSGRTMRYEKVRASRRIEVDEETGQPKAKTVYTAEVGGRRVSLYGGKLSENCQTGDTEILTETRGWVRLDSLLNDELVWDGVEFVTHGGLVNQGFHITHAKFGFRATPDHLFFTESGWCPWSCCDITGDNRLIRHHELPTVPTAKSDTQTLWLPDCVGKGRVVPGQDTMEGAVRLRGGDCEARQGDDAGESVELRSRLPDFAGSDSVKTNHPRDEQPPRVCGMEKYAGSLPEPKTPGLQELRGSWYLGLRPLGRVFREILGRLRASLLPRTGPRPDRQQSGVSTGELSMDNPPKECAEPTGYPPPGRLSRRLLGRGRAVGDIAEHSLLPHEPRAFVGADNRYPREREELVFDILNCGPRNCFVVRSPSTGMVLLAHNCTQAVARDVFAGHLLKLDEAGLNPLFSVHDEVICEVPKDTPVKAVLDIMSQPPTWFPACPVAAEAVEADRYLK